MPSMRILGLHVPSEVVSLYKSYMNKLYRRFLLIVPRVYIFCHLYLCLLTEPRPPPPSLSLSLSLSLFSATPYGACRNDAALQLLTTQTSIIRNMSRKTRSILISEVGHFGKNRKEKRKECIYSAPHPSPILS